MRQYATVALMSCVLSAGERPTNAQSNSGFELARTSFTSVREYVATEAIPTHLSAPPNVVIPDMYRPLLNTILRHSPTFRRQCLRIAAESGLTVYITIEPLNVTSDVRAITRVTREQNGRRVARVVIGPMNDTVELIAHELEHVIEQLDGVDLESLAGRARTGVYKQNGLPGSFETVRARDIGRKVTAEILRSS